MMVLEFERNGPGSLNLRFKNVQENKKIELSVHLFSVKKKKNIIPVDP